MEGIRKLHYHLTRYTEYQVTRAKLQEIMFENGLIIQKKKEYRVITDSNHKNRVSDNLLRTYKPDHVFQVLVSDITVFRTRQREYYMTAIMDLYARLILCFALSHDLTARSLINIFSILAKLYPDKLRGCIFHSDRGTQFCSLGFRRVTEEYGVALSNSRTGNPYDNSCMERVFSTLKNEYMLKIVYPDFQSLAKATKDAVYSYNNKRHHMSLKMMTPKEYFLADIKSY